MSFKINLGLAIDLASRVVVNGYEIEEFSYSIPGLVRLGCCGGDAFERYYRMADTVEVDDYGCAKATEYANDGEDPEVHTFEFRIERPLSVEDI